MTEPATVEITLGTWQRAMMGLLHRHVGQRIRLTVDHPGQIDGRPARGQHFEGELEHVDRSDVSSVYVELRFREDDGTIRTFHLPLDHPIEVLVLPQIEPAAVDEERARALVLEAIRRFDVDPRFHAQAELAARLAEQTEYAELEGAVLVGAVLALVVADHPELLP